MAKKEEFQHESIQDNHTVSQYLQALIDGLESGTIVLNSEDKQIIFHPGDLMEMVIKAKKKGDKNKISLKFSWKDTPGGRTEPVRITT